MSKVTLPEPVIVERFWLNRRHDALVVSFQTYEGRNIINVRKHAMNKTGQLQPTPKGVAMAVLRLPELLAAITKAHAAAVELGLLTGEDSDEDGT